VREKKTLTATYTYDVLSLADVVIVDVQLDYLKKEIGNVRSGNVEMSSLEESFEIIAHHIKPDALVLIETTVAPGTTEQIAFPLMKKVFRKRGIESDPLLAHSYERVMPGRNYVASVRDFWRVCSGVNDAATARVVQFLSEVLNTKDYPLTVLDRPIESETAKIVENSFRATILAFMDEWSKFAERNGIDIVKVINAVKVRPTHNNLLFPGPGIGGYCLPKDGGLGLWAYRHILGFEDDLFKVTPLAIDINDTRGLHAAQFVRDALRNMNFPIAGADILILGASYREDVGDTRYSGSEVIVRRLTDMGAEIRVHDPYVDQWWEFVSQDSYPSQGLKGFFRNQKKLTDLRVQKDLNEVLKGIDALVFAVRHKTYLDLDPEEVVRVAGGPIAVIDCFGVLDDAKIRGYLQLGCEVKGLGRGLIRRIKEEIKKERVSEG
jgi:nucleotide sugar dehydrogenase